MTRARIATVKGTFLVPGVSKNGRLYTREAITAAVDRMRRRLVAPDGLPLTMLSHHAAEDDSTRIVGRITNATTQSDGSATFEAEIADTDAGRDIAALTTGDTPFLKSVSIRGWWLGPVRQEQVNGQAVETADDIEIDGVDFTKSPGVTGAHLSDVHFAETAAGRRTLTESLEAVLVTETAPAPVFADPGYQTDGSKRLPLNTAAQVRSAWGRVHTREGYTPAQAKRIKGRIKTAAKNLGVQVAEETTQLAASVTEALEEAWATMSLDSGPGEIRVSGYTNEPADLPAVGRRVALAAMAGLTALDPDNDGDIDIDPDDSIDICAACTADVPPGAAFCPACGAPLTSPTGESTTPKEAPVTEQTSTTPATETAPEIPTVEAAPEAPVTDTPATPVAPTTETAPATPAVTEAAPVGFTEAHLATLTEALISKVEETVTAKVSALRDEILTAFGRPTGRRGLVKTEETAAPAKPLHEMSTEEFRDHAGKTWDSVLPPIA